MRTTDDWQDIVTSVQDKHDGLLREFRELEAENKILRECAEYYANEDNWRRSNKALFNLISVNDSETAKNKTVNQVYYRHLEVGGKRARQVLAKIKE